MSGKRAERDSRIDDFQSSVYGVLAHPDRRTVLRYVAPRRLPVSVDRLAREVAAAKHGVSGEEVTRERRTDALVALVHLHLPKLDDAGFVRWDREAGRVARTPLLTEIAAMPVTGSVFDPFPTSPARTG